LDFSDNTIQDEERDAGANNNQTFFSLSNCDSLRFENNEISQFYGADNFQQFMQVELFKQEADQSEIVIAKNTFTDTIEDMAFEIIFGEDHDLKKAMIHVESNTFSRVSQKVADFFHIVNNGDDFSAIVNFTSNTYDRLYFDSAEEDEEEIASMINYQAGKSMELFVSGDKVSDSELHSFAKINGTQFVIFKHVSFKNINTPELCERNEYEDEYGLIDAENVELFNIMESEFNNITLDQNHSIVRGDGIVNHMFYASNVSDITLADKARVLNYKDFEELFIEANVIQKVKYSQLNGEFALNIEQSERTRKLIIRDSRIRQLESGLAEIVLGAFPDVFYELED
jgi:hypothetical protein